MPKISIKEQQPFITLVDRILAAKQQAPAADLSALERQIDLMVYTLYGLTDDEVQIIDPEFALSAEEYQQLTT
jgi:adenine-specific DNA-methyltransferase